MKNIYNKGKNRSGEWAKHLRPFLKNISNRKWRRSAQEEILEELEMPTLRVKICRKAKKKIAVKLKLKSIGDRTYSYSTKYRTLRAANDSIKRNNVISAIIFE